MTTGSDIQYPPIKINKNVACIDLFCGAGGLTHGLISAGVNVLVGVDYEEACRHPYETNHRGIRFQQVDIRELASATVAEWFGNATVRVLAGCAPCQPFSSYARRYQKQINVESDHRWSLLDHFGRLVRELLPDIVAMENVPSVRKHSVFKNFKITLENLGYTVWDQVVDCTQYGLPQRRSRTVLLASLHGDIKLHTANPPRIKTVKDAIHQMPVLRNGSADNHDRMHAAARLSNLNYERILHSKPGGTWRDWPKRLIANCHAAQSGKKYPSVYGRMEYDKPAPTLTTQFYGFGNGRFGHPTQPRGISLREGALLQGFPKDYSFVAERDPINFRSLGRLIGNAVPVHLGQAIGETIIQHVNQNLQTIEGRH